MSSASERATELIEEIKKAVGVGDGFAEWWAEDADRVNKMAEKARKFAAKVTKAAGKEQRSDDCGRVDGGKFGPGNDCQKEGDGSADAESGKSQNSKDSEPERASTREVLDEILRSIEATGGFSVHPVTAESPTTGYMCATVPGAEKIIDSKNDVTEEVIDQYFETHRDYLSSRPKLHLGGWIDSESDKVYLDLSERFETQEEAEQAAVKHKQLAIWDIANKKEIRIKNERAAKEDGEVRLSSRGDLEADRRGHPGGEEEGRQGIRRGEGQRAGRPDKVWTVEPRAYCATGEGGGVDNSCSSSDGGAGSAVEAIASSEKVASPEGPRIWTPGQPTGLVTARVAASPPTTRSEDGKSIVSTEIPDAHVYPFAGREWVSTIDTGAYLSSLQDEFRGGVINTATGRGELPPEDLEYIASALSDQAAAASSRGIVPLFYSPEELDKQLDEFSSLVPQVRGGRTKDGTLVEQEDAEHLFRVLQAITSPNASPFSNMQRTDSLLRKFFEGDGRVTTSDKLGVTGPGIRKSLQRFQRIVDTLGKRTDGSIDVAAGLKAARELMLHRMIPASDVESFFSDFASPDDAKGAWKAAAYRAGEVIPAFSTFGPKVGPFYENNQGNHDPLTADVWFTRTWGRITGELVVPGKPEKAVKYAEKLIGAFKGATEGHYHGISPQDLHESIRRTSQNGVVDDLLRVWSADRLRHFAAGGFKEKSGVGGRLNRIAKNIVENDTSLMGDPGAASRRGNMIRAMNEASARTGMPVAYLQDVLWQDEQDAYAAAGAKTATNVGQLSLYSDQIRRIAEDQKKNRRPIARKDRSDRRSYEVEEEFYDDYDRGGREQMLWDAALANVDDQEFADAFIAMANGTRRAAPSSRAFCPTGEGGGIKNDCSPKDSPGEEEDDSDGGVAADPSPPPAPPGGSGPEINIGDKREEIDRRLDAMGVVEDDVVRLAGGDSDGTYVFMRRDHDHEGGDGLHVETTRDVAGVKGGLFSQSVVYNAGPADDPEIVVDHKLMDVKTEVSRDPQRRHAAAREFFRIMTSSVEASIKQGVSKVVLNAAGDARQARDGMFKGYTIWPRMGFDAPIPFHIRNKLPETLSHCRSLLDLHATSEGTRWWRDNGTDLDVQLDLTRADSPQMQVFGKFVRHFERNRRDFVVGEGEGWLSPDDTTKLEELWEEIWDEGLLDDYEGEAEDFSTLEKRAFCATGEGGGVKNDCPPASSGGGTETLDTSWHDSDEVVEMWEQEDLKSRPPIEDAGKLHSLAIESPTEMKAAIDELGVSLSDAITMCAAPSEGTTVIVSPEHPHDSMGLANYAEESKAVAFVMTTKDIAGIKDGLDSNSSLRKTKDGELVLEYHAFHASKEAQEKAAVACAREVIGGVLKSVTLAEKSDVSEIRLDAAGSREHESFKGYRIWPKFGFDGVIPRKMLTKLREADLSPRAVAEKRAGKLTIQALYETKAGQEYWEKHGQELPMSLRPGDESTPGWQRFLAYRQRLGKLAELRSFEAGDEIFSEEELKKLDELWEEFRKGSGEKRGFCPTGEGGGIDNSCGSDGKQGPPADDDELPMPMGRPSKNGWKTQEALIHWDSDSLKAAASPTKETFDAKSFTIVDGEEFSAALESVGVTIDQALRVMANPDQDTNVIATAGGTEYAMSRLEGGPRQEDQEPGVTVVSRKDVGEVEAGITATTSLIRRESGELELNYALFALKPEVQQSSSVTIARQLMTSVAASITAADEIGVDVVSMRAAGSPSNEKFKGYRIWPRMGFDGEIPRKLVTRTWSPMKGVFNSYGDRIPNSILSPRAMKEKSEGKLTVQALYETKEGQRWWEQHGGGMDMSLSPKAKDSPGWQVFSKVRERYGKSSRDWLELLDEVWVERRAFCPTGEGGGIDNSCGAGPRVMMAPDGAGGGGSVTSSRWGGDEAEWGTSSGTEIWTPGRPLFAGSESLASIKIHRPDDIRERIVDGLGMTIAEAVLASGPVSEAADRANITRPRLEIIPQQFGDGIEMHWSSMGVTTGEGFQDDEKQFAKSGTAVKAVEASRNISKGRDGNVLHMAGFFVHPDFQGKGLALESVSKSVSSGAVRLVMDAERFDSPSPDTRMTGYHVWPKYGYDAPIADVARALRSGSIPEQFAKAKSLLDIYAMPGGHEWWRENGGPIKLTFDARTRSRSWETLLKFQDRTRERRSMSAPENYRRGIDCDNDPALDEVWAEIREKGLSGKAPSQEDWDRWAKEDQEAKDGKAREV